MRSRVPDTRRCGSSATVPCGSRSRRESANSELESELRWRGHARTRICPASTLDRTPSPSPRRSTRPAIATACPTSSSKQWPAARPGETGLVVPPRNVEALTAAIDALAASPEWPAELGARGRRVVEREYDVRQCAAQFVGLVESAYA